MARRSTGGGEHAADLRVLERFNGFAVRTGKRGFQDLACFPDYAFHEGRLRAVIIGNRPRTTEWRDAR
jgi:hypothetical protein